jgi:hypothetical protein
MGSGQNVLARPRFRRGGILANCVGGLIRLWYNSGVPVRVTRRIRIGQGDFCWLPLGARQFTLGGNSPRKLETALQSLRLRLEPD